ncbi:MULTISPECIES: FkbM family methyltransferase [unclassified Rubrivivax]|uniref:FkbM family methyltransferase n=1 Tax=unclassified Rubrivivax TaxID=2649762 RepID=UPI001E4F17E0|nr:MULTISPECIES: FkbM family methyltransferase [unclassified Rubrivivax]MCC9596342.1 FkbM family methyltransferase [Rubrivivax sp. JA1055]MCC9647316.1 FkbM family methyltransferase [Rubrivivax sp. JA1029]
MFERLMLRALSRYLMNPHTQRFKWRAYAAGLKALERTEGLVDARLRSGEVFQVPAHDYAGARLALTGQWEPTVTAVIRHLLRPGDVFVDVGANFGYYSIAAARWVGPQGRVFAFECAPRALGLLKTNVALNRCADTVRVQDCGLSDESGEMRFFQSRLDTGWSSLDPIPDAEELRVSIRRLDELDLAGPDIRLVKIDVEGGEAKVLRGMQAVFARGSRPFVIAEITPRFKARGGAAPLDTFAYLGEFGYEALRIPRIKAEYGPHSPAGFSLSRTSAAEIERAGRQEDVLFVPAGEASRLTGAIPFA